MPIKKNTNKLSQLYRTIDQKELSKEALDTLAKLRLATGNFRKQEGKEVDAFKLFFDRLIKNKPTAVKTTPEYKAMIKERRSENGRKAMEARKAKQESRQGQGSEEDAKRPAKPFGWRLKGKHNYRKPTRADISSGKAYYEARINRADSKRTKFPMLERGGFMSDGGEMDKMENQELQIKFKIASVIGIDEALRYADMDFAVSPFRLIRGAVVKGFITIDEINKDLFDAALSESYDIDEMYKDSGQGIGGSDMNAFIANMLNDAGIRIKVVNNRWQRMADGGFMAEGGAIKNQYEGREAEDIWNNLTRVQRKHFLVDHEDDLKLKEDGTSTKDYFETRDALARLKFSELKKNIQDEFAVHTFMGQYADGGFMAKGGDIVRNLNKNSYMDMFNFYLDNNETPVSKGNLIKMAYGNNTTGIDSAIPQSMVGDVDNTSFYVYDYQTNKFGELVDLRKKLQFSNVPVALTIVLDGKLIYGDDLMDELRNITFNRALNYVFKNKGISNFDIRPISNSGMMADGGFMAKGGETYMLKEGQAVYNAVGKKLLVDKVTNDEYYLTSFMQVGSSPFSKEKVHRYLKSGEWTLKPKMADGGFMAKGGVFYSDSHKLGHE